MRIGLDARNAGLAQGTGVASYARALAAGIEAIGMAPQWLAAGPSAGRIGRLLAALRPAVRLRGDFSAPDIFRVAQVHFNLFGRSLRLHAAAPPALMHWTYPLPLHLAGVPNIVTVHDLIPVLQPALTGIDGARMRRILAQCFAHAAAVVTVSETVRGQLIERFALPATRVVNLYQAVQVDYPAETPAICPPGQFVVIGSVEPRKNLARLAAAYRASGVAERLVVIGPEGGGEAALQGAGPGLLRIPYAPRAGLLRAIAEARAVLFPSLAEGFGLPIAEGFALGTPVMTASGGATEEIAGGAARLVDPLDVAQMAAAIAELARDAGLRARLRAAGFERAACFAPAAYTARLQGFYDRVLHPGM